MSLFGDVPAASVLEAARAAFAAAASAGPLHVRDVRFADQHIRLELVGDEALAAFTLPFTPTSAGVPDLTLRVWDATSPGAALAPPVLTSPRCLEPRALFADASISGRGGGADLSDGHPSQQVFWEPFWVFGFDLAAKVAWFHCPAVATVPAWSRAHPFLKLLHPWLRTRGIHILHAGAVGCDGRCALIVGPGGAGKSTLSIASRMGGLDYLGDDYVAVRLGLPVPRAFGLYRIAKLVPAHMRALLPAAEALVAPVAHDDEAPQKSHLVLAVTHPDGLDVAAIIVPQVTHTSPSLVRPIGGAHALRALAPSTLFQLPGYPADLAPLSGLTRRVPAYGLTLGPDMASAIAAVRALTARPPAPDSPPSPPSPPTERPA